MSAFSDHTVGGSVAHCGAQKAHKPPAELCVLEADRRPGAAMGNQLRRRRTAAESDEVSRAWRLSQSTRDSQRRLLLPLSLDAVALRLQVLPPPGEERGEEWEGTGR